MQPPQGWHENFEMDLYVPVNSVPELPSASAARRFWIAWLVFLLALLVGFVVIILIASVTGEPARIPPVG